MAQITKSKMYKYYYSAPVSLHKALFEITEILLAEEGEKHQSYSIQGEFKS